MTEKNNVSLTSRRVYCKIRDFVNSGTFNGSKVWMFERAKFRPEICKFSAVYVFTSKEGDVLYVGKANDVSDRVKKHMEYASDKALIIDYVHEITLIKTGGEVLEQQLIQELKPVFNTVGADNCVDFSTIQVSLLSKYPKHRNEIMTQVVNRHRALNSVGKYSKTLSIYREEVDLDVVLGQLSILQGNYDNANAEEFRGDAV